MKLNFPCFHVPELFLVFVMIVQSTLLLIYNVFALNSEVVPASIVTVKS